MYVCVCVCIQLIDGIVLTELRTAAASACGAKVMRIN